MVQVGDGVRLHDDDDDDDDDDERIPSEMLLLVTEVDVVAPAFVPEQKAEPDLVNHPPHYKIKGDMEVIDVIEALAKDDAWYANAIKYLLRAKKKGKLTEDLGKCKFYIDRMLRDAESEAK